MKYLNIVTLIAGSWAIGHGSGGWLWLFVAMAALLVATEMVGPEAPEPPKRPAGYYWITVNGGDWQIAKLYPDSNTNGMEIGPKIPNYTGEDE